MIKANQTIILRKQDNKQGRDANETRFYKDREDAELRPYKNFILADYRKISNRIYFEQAWSSQTAKSQVIKITANRSATYLMPLMDFKQALFSFAEKDELIKWTMLDDRDCNIELHKHKKITLPDYSQKRNLIFEMGWNKAAKAKMMLRLIVREAGKYIFRRQDLEEMLWWFFEGKRLFSWSVISDINRRMNEGNL